MAEMRIVPPTLAPPANGAARRIVGIREAEEVCGVSRVTIWRLLKRGEFPKPGGIGYRRKWYLDELVAWRDERMAEGYRINPTPTMGAQP